jgi:hypothetical protein
MRPALAWALTATLAVTSVGMFLGWRGVRPVARVVCWAVFVLFALLVVPDWDDAMTSGAYGLHKLCGVLAGYFLLCAIYLGFAPRPN